MPLVGKQEGPIDDSGLGLAILNAQGALRDSELLGGLGLWRTTKPPKLRDGYYTIKSPSAMYS